MKKAVKTTILALCLLTTFACVSVPKEVPPKIGIIDFMKGGVGVCTAFPVHGRLLITAGHCLVSEGPIDVYITNEHDQIIAYADAHTVSNNWSNPEKTGNISQDWGLIILDRHIDFPIIHKLSADKLPDKVVITGWKGGDKLIRQEVDVVIRAEGAFSMDTLLHRGMSGGPVTAVNTYEKTYGILSVRGLDTTVAVGFTPDFVLFIDNLIATIDKVTQEENEKRKSTTDP